MLEVEKTGKPPKRHAPSGSVGRGPPACAASSVTSPRSPAASLASPSRRFKTQATNTPHGLGWGAGGCLPETEVKLEFVDVDERAVRGHSKVGPSASPKGSESDLPLRRKRPRPLPSPSSVPAPDRAFPEAQEEGTLGLHVHGETGEACSLGRPGLHPAASREKRPANPGRSKPKGGDSGLCSLKSVPGQEPPGQPEKKVSKQKARGQREEGEPTGKKSRDPALSSGRSPSTAALLRAAGPDRPEVGQPSENEEAKQADLLIARLAREVRRLKKWKKRRSLAAGGDESPPLSLRKPPCLKKLVRTLKAETKGWALPGPSPGPPDAAGHKAASDLRRFFTVDCKDAYHVTCTLCHASVRQGKFKGHFQTSGLVRHLVSKHGLERERRPTAASPGEKRGGAQERKHKRLPAQTAGLAPEGLPSPRRCADASPPVDGGRQLAEGRPEQLPAPPLWPPARGGEPAASPPAVGEGRGGAYAPGQPRAQAWTRSIAELLCSLALPLSFVSSLPFRRFMAQVDPCYRVPPPAFFSATALPLLREAVDEQVCREMQRAKGSCVHLTVSAAARDAVADYVALTAHWGAIQLGSRRVASGSLRRQAVLWVRGLPQGSSPEERQRELREQVGLWLGRSALRPGFLVSGGCLSLEQAVRAEGYTHLPCFAHCLDSLIRNFLRHHQSVQLILGTVRAICSHFRGSAEARQLLGRLQRQCGLPAHQPFWELSDHWVSACRLLEWLAEQRRPLQAYERERQLGKAGTALSATFWSLTDSLVTLLQPFRVAVREAGATRASLSQVLPQLRYLHIFLEQAGGHFEEQGGGEAGAAVRLAQGLALQLSTDRQLNELFHRKEFVLATLLDPRFKGKIESILPAGADIDHWKQVLVYKVKEIMVSDCPLPLSPSLHSPRARRAGSARGARSRGAEGQGQKAPVQGGGGSGSLLLGQREKSLLEQLESVGLLASERSGASLSTESHLASVLVKKYLRENEAVGAQEDPLAYWERRQEVWPALARLATVYLSCPPTGAFSASVCASLGSPALVEHSAPLPVGTVEHLLFLKTNLESFPDYPAPALLVPGGDPAEGEQDSEADLA